MKTVTLHNEYGETIEIKRGKEAGVINIRHSDVDPKRFGRYHEFAERMRHPDAAAFLKQKRIDPTDPKVVAALETVGGGYMVLHSHAYILNSQEVAMIRDAIKQLD